LTPIGAPQVVAHQRKKRFRRIEMLADDLTDLSQRTTATIALGCCTGVPSAAAAIIYQNDTLSHAFIEKPRPPSELLSPSAVGIRIFQVTLRRRYV
jgi:hypothetical protein